MQCFRTAQLYLSELVNSFDTFAISEHCLFEEQLEILEASINYTYKSTAVSAEDNPSILSGKAAHGGVALFWKNCIKDMVTPLENIDSDRIVGIRCDFKLQLHGEIHRLRFYSNSLIHNLSLSNSHNNVTSIQRHLGDKSYRVIVALMITVLFLFLVFICPPLAILLRSLMNTWTTFGLCQEKITRRVNLL